MSDARRSSVCVGKVGRRGVAAKRRHGLACVQSAPALLYGPQGWDGITTQVSPGGGSEEAIPTWKNHGTLGDAYDLAQATAADRPYVWDQGYNEEAWAFFYEGTTPGNDEPPNPGAFQYTRFMTGEFTLTGNTGLVMAAVMSRRQDDGASVIFNANDRAAGANAEYLRFFYDATGGLRWGLYRYNDTPDLVGWRSTAGSLNSDEPHVVELESDGSAYTLLNEGSEDTLSTWTGSGGGGDWFGDVPSCTHFVLGQDRVDDGADPLPFVAHHHQGAIQFLLVWEDEVPSDAIRATLRAFLQRSSGAA